MKRYKTLDDMENGLLDQPPGEFAEEVYPRLRFFTAMDLCCKFMLGAFGCAWVIFLVLFGTGKLFSSIKSADAAVTWRNN